MAPEVKEVQLFIVIEEYKRIWPPIIASDFVRKFHIRGLKHFNIDETMVLNKDVESNR